MALATGNRQQRRPTDQAAPLFSIKISVSGSTGYTLLKPTPGCGDASPSMLSLNFISSVLRLPFCFPFLCSPPKRFMKCLVKNSTKTTCSAVSDVLAGARFA